MSETQVETKKAAPTAEEQMFELRKLAEMKHKTFTQLLGLHIDGFSAIMVNGNGVSYAKKIQAAQALKEAVMFALDFGLDVSKAKIREGGALAKETNNLAGVMLQALDNRMLLMADRMNEKEKEDAAKASATETTEGDSNELEK